MGQAVLALDGCLLAVNDAWCQLTGHGRSALLTRSLTEIIHPDDRPGVAAQIDALQSGQLRSAEFEARCVCSDGRMRWTSGTLTLVGNEQGGRDHLVAFLVDIDERKRLQTQLHERDALLASLTRNIPGTLIKFALDADGRMRLPYASDGIGELYEMDPQLLFEDPMRAFDRIHPEDRSAALGLMQQHIDARTSEAASQAKSDFLSRMSHELRTPLNAVIGFAQILRLDATHPLQAAQAAKVEMIERAGEHLLAMISDVLDLSRIESGSMTLSLEPVDATAALCEALSFVSDAANRARVELLPPLCEPGLFMRTDRLRLRQVLINLLSNAIKYNHVGGRVHSRLWRDDQRVRIEIADTGPGLTAQQQADLFTPFNRLGAELSGIEGTGIGLVIVRHLVTLMGGQIEVKSQPGQGAKFTIDLPATQALAVIPAPRPHPWSSGKTVATRGHVLYAEDNEVNVLLVRDILQMRGGVELSVATSGAKAIEAVRSRRPDLLLLDMHLGDMTGFDVAEALDRDPATANIPRVILSADAMPSTVAAAKARHFAAYLTKPLDAHAILQCLDDLLPRASI